MLNRETFLQARVFRTEDVDVPELGDKCRVRLITSVERQAASKIAAESGEFDPARYQAAVVCYAAIDESGNQIFMLNEVDTIAAFPEVVIAPIFIAAARLNGMGPKSVDDAEKNSSASPSAASS